MAEGMLVLAAAVVGERRATEGLPCAPAAGFGWRTSRGSLGRTFAGLTISLSFIVAAVSLFIMVKGQRTPWSE